MSSPFVPDSALAAEVEVAVMARGGRVHGDTIKFQCPAHEDEHPSASYNTAKHVWKCHSCGEGGGFLDLAKRLGIELARAASRSSRIVATYPYTDETGALLFEVVRYEPKKFSQRRPDGHGGHVDNITGVRRVLYRLPEVLAAVQHGRRVYITEGEKDAEALVGIGLCATTGPMGAGKWRDEYATVLIGADVVVIADKDDRGRTHAKQVALSCANVATTVKVIEMPGDHVKDATDWIAAGGNASDLEAIVAAAPMYGMATPTAETAELENGAALLVEIAAFIRRFVVLTPEAADTTALFVVHTHAFGAADATPYLNVKSAEKRSGKTRLLEAVELIVARPWLTGRTTAAALARKVDSEQPTLLLDESDAAFGGDKEYAEVLRGVLNSGHRRGGRVTVCVVQGMNITTRDFTTFCPKAIAGIGKLPDTVADRSIPIALRRRGPGEAVERFRVRKITPEAKALRDRVERWATQNTEALRGAEPALPDELDDRAQDAWEPLLAIADQVGGEWPDRARRAARVLSGGEARDDDSIGVRLLADSRRVFDEAGADRLATAGLIKALSADQEAPWCEWNKGKEITPRGLGKLLKPFGIASRQIRLSDERTAKGYLRESFTDAWNRYLPGATTATPAQTSLASETTTQPDIGGLEMQIAFRNSKASVSDAKAEENPTTADVVSDVSDLGVQQARGATNGSTTDDEMAAAQAAIEGWPEGYRNWLDQTIAYSKGLGHSDAEAFWLAYRDIGGELHKARYELWVKGRRTKALNLAANDARLPDALVLFDNGPETAAAIRQHVLGWNEGLSDLGAQIALLPPEVRDWWATALALGIATGRPADVWQIGVVDVLEQFATSGSGPETGG